ncbi:hypothetical protein [Thiorhodovibrio frisius]|uniref:Uncharacterized protein n=1 Tax=Thiorhodovibrio frisius TaxID=631362 RepID=H8YVS1_9GAMM|nr:hypothetical protein [Thiorhodovibrio frisius]EIC24011.1 hypothetical protein Thi970DRAFT_00148 [Thiorhodovibrio frisius]WPL23083.1 hypothetical protein Thiofri_03265 [Thiorhodovibrio frisius]
MGEMRAKRTSLSGASMAIPVLVGALGGLVGALVADRMMAELDVQATPILVLSVADWVRGGQDGEAIRTLAERLAEHGFLVLDDQAVLAAPEELYLPPTEGQP